MYLHPQLLIPTIIDNALRPVVSLALPGMLASYLGLQITEDTNPIAWGVTELASSCLGLLITLPFETVRRRLQVQTRGMAKPIKGCVELRPKPYYGVVDTLWSILTEERSDLPRLKRARRRTISAKGKERAAPDPTHIVIEGDEEGWFRRSGIAQLYRGLGMRLGASAVVFLLALVAGDDSNSGWAEL
jgi:mitochondrial fusion and transport protein UGO1